MALTQVNGGMLDSIAQQVGFRNRIINGAMGIWQRGTSFTVAANTYTYTADRMNVVSGNSSTTVSRSTSVPTGVAQYSLQLQRTAGNTGTSSIVAAQVIESVNCYDLSGQTVTISFYAKAGANYSGGQLATTLWTGTAADQGITSMFGSWTGSAYTAASQTLTTTWTRFSFQATVPASTLEAGIAFSWTGSGTAGADDSVYITGVQLEKGSTATSFDYRPYGTELVLCQRYYQFIGRAGSGNDALGSGFTTGTSYYGTGFLRVTMRASPSMSYTGSISDFSFTQPGVSFTCTGILAATGNPDSYYLGLNNASATTNGFGAYARITGSGTALTFSAEL